LIASNPTLSHNQAIGGAGHADGILTGVGIGGGFTNFDQATATVSNSTIDHNQAIGGQGVASGNGSEGWAAASPISLALPSPSVTAPWTTTGPWAAKATLAATAVTA
jgi:hypothetical protein